MEATIDVEMEIPEEQNPNIGIPLFLKKLWKMVNDKDVEHIICWNETEDGFIILDQFAFSSKVLPQYFKHNNMSSFVRQLHFYNFRKVQTTNDRIQFAHNCFLKGVPELLVLIRRKTPVLKQREITSRDGKNDFLDEIKQLRNKNALINEELAVLKQENLTLWSELNSLRMKYEKQLSIVNKLINFLISYIHTHQTSYAKQNMSVPRSNQNNLQSSPKIFELDYKDKKDISANKTNQTSYTKFEPCTSNSHGTITYSVKIPESLSKTRYLQKILSSNHSMKLNKNLGDEITYSIKFPTNQSGKMISSDLQESLFELLRENERLSIENPSEDILTGINAVDTSVEDMGAEFDDPIQEFVPAFSSSAGNTYFTVGYPKEYTQNIQSYAAPSMQGSSTDVLDKNSSAPTDSPNTIEMYKNMNKNPESTQIIERTSKADIYHNIGSRKKNEITVKLPLNISTSDEVENNIHSQKLLQSTPSGESKGDQSLLEFLMQNENENPYDNALGIQQKSLNKNVRDPDFFLQKNVESISPLVESPAVGIEYIVEEPDWNSNSNFSSEMDCLDMQEITGDALTDTIENSVNSISPSVYVGSKDYDVLINPPSPNINAHHKVIGQVSYLSGNEASPNGSRLHALNKTKKQSLSTKNIHYNELGTQENTISVPAKSCNPRRHVESLSQTNFGQMFPDVDSSEIGTDNIVQITNSNLNQSNIEMEHAETLDELLKVVEPIAECSEISELEDPNSPLRRVHRSHRTGNELFPIENKFGLGKRKLQQNNSIMQMNKAAPTLVKNNTYSRNSSNETTLRSFKTSEFGKKKASKVKESSPKPRKGNTVSVSYNPIIQMPSVSETKYTVQAPDLKSTYPCINENLLPDFPTRNSIPLSKNSLEHKIISDMSKRKSESTKLHSKKRAKPGVPLRSPKIRKNESVKIEDAKVQKSLLEILKKKESFSNVDMLSSPKHVMDTNIQAMRNLEILPHENGDRIPTFFGTSAAAPDSNLNPQIDGIGFENIGDTVESKVSNSADRNIPPSLASNNELNSLGTPNSYSETSQEDLSMLQDFLDSFNSKDLNDIISIEKKSNCPEDENPTHMTIYGGDDSAQVNLVDPLVDQYFSPHLFQNV